MTRIPDPRSGESVRLVSRKECGLPRSRAPHGAHQRHHGICHHGVGRGAGLPLDEAMAIWRGYWRYHVKQRGWSDLGYTAGYCDAPDVGGAVLEGRWWGKDGAHTQNGGNSQGYACCFIGDGRYTEGSAQAWRAWRAWLDAGRRADAFPAQMKISGHDDWYRKVCPGPKLKAVLHRESDLSSTDGGSVQEEDELPYIDEDTQKWLQEFADASRHRGMQPASFGYWHRVLGAIRRQTAAHHTDLDSHDADAVGVTVADGANSGARVKQVSQDEGFSLTDLVRGCADLLRRNQG